MVKAEQIRGYLTARVTWTLLWKGAGVKCSPWARSRTLEYAFSISLPDVLWASWVLNFWLCHGSISRKRM